MNRRKEFNILILLFFFNIICYSQNPKGPGNYYPTKTLIANDTLYSTTKHRCYVLTIGVETFDEGREKSLNYPKKDCHRFSLAVYQLFRFQYKIIEKTLGKDDKNRLYNKVDNILSKGFDEDTIEKGDVVFLYFSGHGKTVEDHYKFPLKDRDLEGCKISELAVKLANRGALVLLFLDTCQSGSITKENFALNDGVEGGIVIFPAASQDYNIDESVKNEGSEYGKRLFDVLSGNLLSQGKVTLTIEDLSDSIRPVMKDGVQPFCSDSALYKLSLVKNIVSLKEYNQAVHNYKLFIDNGRDELDNGYFEEAWHNFKLALELEKSLYEEDLIRDERRKNLSKSIDDFKKRIKKAPMDLSDEDRRWVEVEAILNDDTHPKLDDKDYYRLYSRLSKYYGLQNDCGELADKYENKARIIKPLSPNTEYYLGATFDFPGFSGFFGFTTILDFKVEIGCSWSNYKTAKNVFLYSPKNNISPYGYDYTSWKWRPFLRVEYEFDLGQYIKGLSITPLGGFSYTRINGTSMSEFESPNGIGNKADVCCWSLQGRIAYAPFASSPNKFWKNWQIQATGGYEWGCGDENYKVLRKVDDIKNMVEGWRVQGGIIYNF